MIVLAASRCVQMALPSTCHGHGAGEHTSGLCRDRLPVDKGLTGRQVGCAKPSCVPSGLGGLYTLVLNLYGYCLRLPYLP